MTNHSHGSFQESLPNLHYNLSLRSCHGLTGGGSFATVVDFDGASSKSWRRAEALCCLETMPEPQGFATSTIQDNPYSGKSTTDFDHMDHNPTNATIGMDNLFAFAGFGRAASCLSDDNFAPTGPQDYAAKSGSVIFVVKSNDHYLDRKSVV